MREIKFRGKIDGIWHYTEPYNPFDYEYSWEAFWYLVDKNTVSQYTGLKDKNGVEIYEEDISVIGEELCVMSWTGYGFAWKHWKTREQEYPVYTLVHDSQDIEVIGNIYENPELLTENGK